VGGDFVVFEALRGADDGRIPQPVMIVVFAPVIIALCNQALYPVTGFGFWPLIELFERLLDARDMRFGLGEMTLERVDQLVVTVGPAAAMQVPCAGRGDRSRVFSAAAVDHRRTLRYGYRYVACSAVVPSGSSALGWSECLCRSKN